MRARRRTSIGVAAVLLASAALAACGGSGGDRSTRTGRPVGASVIRVPQDVRTIGAAVAKAAPGSLVLVGPGVYPETVRIKTPRITLRGTDRNRVIIDGGVQRANGVVVTAPGVAVQNLTVRNATLNGVLITGAVDASGNGIGRGSDGYSPPDAAGFKPVSTFLVDHVTSYNNGLYGIYAFDATDGEIRDSYTSGMADSGIYVGQCKPCRVAVHGNVAERNAVGYEGTNASGSMWVYGNRFVGNRVGATTDSDHQEALLPQRDALIAGNLIAANGQKDTPEQADGGFGIGFGIAGGTGNTVRNNRIEANPVVGVVITNTDDLAPTGNQIRDNVFVGNPLDLAYSATAAAAGSGNCVQGGARTVRPASFPRSCPSTKAVGSAPAPTAVAPPGIPFTDVRHPPLLANLTGASASGAVVVRAPGAPGDDLLVTPAATLLQSQSSIRW